jgi:hypothetical protein
MTISRLRGVVLCALAVIATGCAQYKAPPYATDYEALDRLKATRPANVSVATFQPTDPRHAVNNLTLRGARLTSPSGSFAKYLEDALIRDLKEISAFEPDAGTRIDATILVNEIDISGFVTGTGAMEVELTVVRRGQTALRKTYKANTTFESSFGGIVAIPAGQAAYTDLARTLLRAVYSDPQFVAAIGK